MRSQHVIPNPSIYLLLPTYPSIYPSIHLSLQEMASFGQQSGKAAVFRETSAQHFPVASGDYHIHKSQRSTVHRARDIQKKLAAAAARDPSLVAGNPFRAAHDPCGASLRARRFLDAESSLFGFPIAVVNRRCRDPCAPRALLCALTLISP